MFADPSIIEEDVGEPRGDRRDERGLTVRKAEEATDFVAADFSRIRNANLGRFTLDRLMKIPAALDGRIRVTVHVDTRRTRASAAPLPG